jgi:hypothetical protein
MLESSVVRKILPRRDQIDRLRLGNKFRYPELQDDASKENTMLKTPSSPIRQTGVRFSPRELLTFPESITTTPQRKKNDAYTVPPVLTRRICQVDLSPETPARKHHYHHEPKDGHQNSTGQTELGSGASR